MSATVTVVRKELVNMTRATERMSKIIQREAIKVGIRRAKVYAPVDTGALVQSIKKLAIDTYGSELHYAGFVEDGTQFQAAQQYMAKSANDVNRAMAGIERDAFNGSFRR